MVRGGAGARAGGGAGEEEFVGGVGAETGTVRHALASKPDVKDKGWGPSLSALTCDVVRTRLCDLRAATAHTAAVDCAYGHEVRPRRLCCPRPRRQPAVAIPPLSHMLSPALLRQSLVCGRELVSSCGTPATKPDSQRASARRGFHGVATSTKLAAMRGWACDRELTSAVYGTKPPTDSPPC